MKVVIVDYGMGNLHSVLKSAQTVAPSGANIFLSHLPEEIQSADKVIFPGQGAMPDCMNALNQSGLGDALQDAFKNKPFFGICVGAQLLFDASEEGNTKGLGWFKGQVKNFRQPLLNHAGERLKVPHMGWNNVHQVTPHPLFKDIAQDERFYFVHSYYFAPEDSNCILASTDYPNSFSSAVGKENVFATQFHPEKSHHAGLKLMQNFLGWDGQA